MMTRLLLTIGLVLGSVGLLGPAVPAVLAQEQEDAATSARRATTTVVRGSMDHSRFTRLLTRFVDEAGDVDYAGLKAASDSVLAPYLRQLATADLASLDRDARLALWINAYNALTLKLIVDHYPLQNIWAVTPGPAEPKENSPFGVPVGTVADTTRTLDEIEHEIIRERFDEPRIHFALVCAAASCPTLRREAYSGPRLNQQLDDQTQAFARDKNRIPATENRVALSRILKWYGEDFGPSTDALQQFFAPYFEGRVGKRLRRAAYEVTFLPYDWSLNDQSTPPAAASGR